MDENKICEDREPKYNYCIIKYKELYLKEFSLYPRVDWENNQLKKEADNKFTSYYNQTNKFKISDKN